ncbi:MAG: hypothetical protein CMI58_01710 [Parcubacteria group bacterium]|jgi:hypothetical protein|nr:hypothetical protein [Parcubacteria group bacterium]|tara:strand:- start:2144 stop:2542 length:399 start_codon:yes stop_codon:yes gene_type:complete
MNKRNLFIIFGIVFFSVNLMNGQTVDTLKNKSPAEAAKYALIFPGGGQFYNERYLKGGILIGLEIYSLLKFNEYRIDVKYQNVTSAISKRNKCIWWAFFIYFYGFMDAIVEAHLIPHESVMDTPVEENILQK